MIATTVTKCKHRCSDCPLDESTAKVFADLERQWPTCWKEIKASRMGLGGLL